MEFSSCILTMIYLASYKRVKPVRDIDSLGAWIIRAVSGGIYSHSELVVGEYCYSSSITDGGVRSKETNLVLHNMSHWDLVPLPWADEAFILKYFEETAGEPYGWLDLLLQYVLHLSFESRGDFCSQWVAKALKLSNPGWYNPVSLHQHCKAINS